MNLKLNVLRKVVAFASAATMIAGSAVPVCASKGKKRRPVHKAKIARLRNKNIPKEVDASVIHKEAVDNILNKIDDIGFNLSSAISEYHVKKYFEPKNNSVYYFEGESRNYFNYKKSMYELKSLFSQNNDMESLKKTQDSIKMNQYQYRPNNIFLMSNSRYNSRDMEYALQICKEDLSALEDKIRALLYEYGEKYNDLIQEFQTLKKDMKKYFDQPATRNAIENQVNILRNKIISIRKKIDVINGDLDSCNLIELYDFLIKPNISGIVSDINNKRPDCFNESLKAIDALNLQLEKAVSGALMEDYRENPSLFLNTFYSNFEIICKNFDSLDPNSKIQVSLKLLNMKNLLDIVDENHKIYQNNNVINNILCESKKTISDYICEFFKINSDNYMNDEDINNYLPVLIDNGAIYASRNINELEESVFNIFRVTNKKLLEHKYYEMVNSPQNGEKIRDDAFRLVKSNFEISVKNICDKLANGCRSDKNSVQRMRRDVEKIVQNIKFLDMRFNIDKSKYNLNYFFDSLAKLDSNLKEAQKQLLNGARKI